MEGALETLQTAFAAALEQIEAAPTSTESFARSSTLAAALAELGVRLGRHRAELAVRIQRSEGLSLMSLANQLSISKSRADQLTQRGR